MIVVGHEANSLRKLRSFIKLGVPIIEIDVRIHKERIVAHHGIDGDIPLKLLPLTYSALFMGDSLIPTPIEKIIEIVNGRAELFIDVKDPKVFSKIMKVLDEHGYRGRLYFTCHDQRSLVKFKREYPEIIALQGNISVKLLTLKLLRIVEGTDLDGVSVRYDCIEKDDVDELKKHGYIVAAWTVNSVEAFKRIKDYNIDMVITDRPKLIMKLMKSQQR